MNTDQSQKASSHCARCVPAPILRVKTIVALSAALVVSIGTMLHWLPDTPTNIMSNILLPILTLSILLWVAAPIYRHAIQWGTPTMDTLIALGTGTAWLYSTIICLSAFFHPLPHTHLYFESAIVIIAFVQLGQTFVNLALRRTTQAIEGLTKLQPSRARIITPEGEEHEVPVSQVQRGDLLRIKPGERFPVDGEIVLGQSEVDTAMLTGEALPVFKQISASVNAGTINLTGSLIIRASAVGANSTLAEIIRAVEKARLSKPAIASWADRLAAYFVPIVLMLALFTFATWLILTGQFAFAITTSVSVLVIACPCALGLATPLAVIVGIEQAAKCGIIIQSATILERAANITHIFFDKTGTLTRGLPFVTKVQAFQLATDEFIALAAGLAEHSQHVFSQAIKLYALEQNIKPRAFTTLTEIAGCGLKTPTTLLGKWPWLAAEGVHENPEILSASEFYLAQGQGVIYLSHEQLLRGFIVVSDPLKKGASELIDILHSNHIQTTLLTGDNKKSAAVIANDLGIDNWQAELLPTQKQQIILAAKQSDEIIAMVGDGINDAPALAAADVSIALSSGADIAMANADATLLNSQPLNILNLIAIARSTTRLIKRNLFLAGFYNVLALPIAAGVFYPLTHQLLNPMLAALLMALSSLTVVTSTYFARRVVDKIE